MWCQVLIYFQITRIDVGLIMGIIFAIHHSARATDTTCNLGSHSSIILLSSLQSLNVTNYPGVAPLPWELVSPRVWLMSQLATCHTSQMVRDNILRINTQTAEKWLTAYKYYLIAQYMQEKVTNIRNNILKVWVISSWAIKRVCFDRFSLAAIWYGESPGWWMQQRV